MDVLKKYFGFLFKGTNKNRRTDTGNIVIVPGSIITPYNVFPLNNLSVIANVIERKSWFLLLLFAFINCSMSLSLLIGLASDPDILRLIFLSITGGISYFLIVRLVRPAMTGIRLVSSSGSAETILSRNKGFIIELKQKVIEALSPKNSRAVMVNIDKAELTVQGDAAFGRGNVLKTINNNFKA